MFVLAAPLSYGQSTNSSIGDKFLSDISVAFNDGIAYVTLPLRTDEADLRNLVKVTSSATILMSVDRSVNDVFRDMKKSPALDDAMTAVREYGDQQYALYLPTALYLGGLFGGHDGIRKTGREALEALLFASAVTQSMKWVVGRARPAVSRDPFVARPMDFRDPSDARFSLPSGHATVAFAISTVFARNIDNVYASIGLYGLAIATGISRMYHNRHWASDVFVGAVIGTATGYFITSRNAGASAEPASPLKVTAGFSGIAVEYKF